MTRVVARCYLLEIALRDAIDEAIHAARMLRREIRSAS